MENCVRFRQLIVTADDFGLTRRISEAIGKAHRQGIVTAASLMANSVAFESAVDILKCNPKLDVGLHLNLTEGQPLTPASQIPSLANSTGFLYDHPFKLGAAMFRGKVSAADLEKEVRAQIERCIAAGASITHIDGHKHVHVLPAALGVVCRVAPHYGIKAVRATVEKTPRLVSFIFRNSSSWPQILKQYVFGKVVSGIWLFAPPAQKWRTLNAPRRIYGITQTGFLDVTTFAEIVRGLETGISEIMCHPGYVDDALTRMPTRLRAQRERELELLTRPDVRDLLRQTGVSLISYRDLVDGGIRG
jgi:hopanoid biosynthesis associated protein HpnK